MTTDTEDKIKITTKVKLVLNLLEFHCKRKTLKNSTMNFNNRLFNIKMTSRTQSTNFLNPF
jgi:hypothetical protein